MRRFTKKDEDGMYYVNTSDMGGYAARYENGSLLELYGEIVDTLANYENLAEQKRLVELPCAVGDEVYEIMSVNDSFKVSPRTIKTLTDIVSLMEGGRWGKTSFADKAMADEVCEKMKQLEHGNFKLETSQDSQSTSETASAGGHPETDFASLALNGDSIPEKMKF